jgi:hypothetical protein
MVSTIDAEPVYRTGFALREVPVRSQRCHVAGYLPVEKRRHDMLPLRLEDIIHDCAGGAATFISSLIREA